MIKVEDIKVYYHNKKILNGISLELHDNEMVFLFGENGTGKTTLLKSILGLIEIKTGAVVVENHNLNDLSYKDRAKFMSYVSQTKDSMHTTCFDFILTGVTATLSIFDTPTKKQKLDVLEIMKKMNIDVFKDAYMDEISGGERQLMYVARAFVQDAKTILLDEPCAYLDYDKQHIILKQIKKYIQNTNKTALITTHDPNLALQYANRIYVLNEGKIVANIDCDKENARELFLNNINQIYDNHFDLSDHKYIYYKGDE